MAVACRVEGGQLAGGQLTVRFTEGETPLPAIWQGNSLVFTSRDDFERQMQEIEPQIQPLLILMMLARAYRADPTIGATFRNTIQGKTLIFNVAGPGALVTVA